MIDVMNSDFAAWALELRQFVRRAANDGLGMLTYIS